MKDLHKDSINRHNNEMECEILTLIHPGQDKDKWHS